MQTALTDTAHREKEFENYIVKQLIACGWKVGDTSGYDQNHALYPEDLVTWIQGEGLLPYAEKGPQMSSQAWRDFEDIVQGDAMLFAVFLN